MSGLLQKYPCGEDVQSSTESLTAGLQRKKLRLESQLKDVNDALEALNRNPEMTNVLELILRVGR